MIGEGLFDYQDVIGQPGREAAEWASGQCESRLQVTGVPVESSQGKFWRQLGVEAQTYSSAPIRRAGAEADLPRQHPRQQRRWQAAGARLEPTEGARERHCFLDWLLEQKAHGLAAQGRENVLGAAETRWLHAMVAAEPEAAELWSLRRNGEALAGLLCWSSSAMRYAYTVAYDAQFAELSPGVLALYALLRHTMREGRGFNFLTGEQEFKLRFATGREPLLRYASHHPTP
ncbi:MAG TPA: GNAT family N-acetyltransferase [Terriglobales bacterium]|nr:GNAT family N-acetyltransferase [Terriglobales bacterium]